MACSTISVVFFSCSAASAAEGVRPLFADLVEAGAPPLSALAPPLAGALRVELREVEELFRVRVEEEEDDFEGIKIFRRAINGEAGP
jgi:hypothetical protein